MKFGGNVTIKKRISNNRRVKGFETVGQVGRYLGPMRNSHDGHYVLLKEDQKVLKTTRIVAYDIQDQHEEKKELKELGWTWQTDPEGRTFYQNKTTGEKTWNTPIRLKEAGEPEPNVEVRERRKLNGKQPRPSNMPPPTYLKEMKLKRFEEVEDDTEVTKTLTLHKVYKNLEEWKESLGSELNSRYSKGCLIPIKAKELKELAEATGSTLKMLPTKLVAALKKKVNEPIKKKSRIVACGNMDQSEEEKETYAGGADATAVRSAIRLAALRRWSLRQRTSARRS